MGTISLQSIGSFNVEDTENGYSATIKMGAYKLKSQDFFYGEIMKDGAKVCTIEGNYMGYVDFDGERYWDLRDEDTFKKHFKPNQLDRSPLPSDCTKRADRNCLVEDDFDQAQAEKEKLEELQRHDRKLRAECDARRESGGSKFANI